MKYALLLLLAFACSRAQADDSASWKSLTQKLIAPEAYNPDAGVYTLSHISPDDRAQNRQADYLGTDSVGVGEDGNRAPTYVTADSETWMRREDTWDIDQWFHRADSFGNLLSVRHYHLVEDDQRGVIVYDNLPVADIADPSVQEGWAEVRARWFSAAPLENQTQATRSHL